MPQFFAQSEYSYSRFPLMAGKHCYDLLGGLEKGYPHEVAVLRDTQPTDADTAPLRLTAICTDGVPEAPKPRARLVEFLGDSLTVGEGTVGARSAMEWRMAWISNQFAFPALTAQLLGAEKRVVALGGWGAYMSFDADPEHTIGKIYDRLCAVVPAGDIPYDFSAQRPADAVVINLGTNDASALTKIEAEELPSARAELRARAAELMETVRTRYPRAVIVWAYGLCGHAVEDILRGAVEDVRARGDLNVHYLSLTDSQTLGSRMHPSRDGHRQAAREITDALKQLLHRKR